MSKVYPSSFNPRLRRNSSHLAPLRLEDDYRARSPWDWNFSKPVSLEEVRDEGEQLLVHFVKEEITKEKLETPEVFEEEFDLSVFSDEAHKEWAKAGQELRRLADKFTKTRERRKVKAQAYGVGKDESVTEEKFRTLLKQLFDGGITQDKIVVLFVFCADVAVASLKKEDPAVNVCVLCLKWAVKFMAEYVCGWVQQHGGWGAVFDTSVKLIKNIFMCIGIGVVAYFGWKKVAPMVTSSVEA